MVTLSTATAHSQPVRTPNSVNLSTTSVHPIYPQLEDLEQLENPRNQTLLYDGWEDGLGRSIYGAVSISVGEYPIILGLDDMIG